LKFAPGEFSSVGITVHNIDRFWFYFTKFPARADGFSDIRVVYPW
jgi:hypothetical protein